MMNHRGRRQTDRTARAAVRP